MSRGKDTTWVRVEGFLGLLGDTGRSPIHQSIGEWWEDWVDASCPALCNKYKYAVSALHISLVTSGWSTSSDSLSASASVLILCCGVCVARPINFHVCISGSGKCFAFAVASGSGSVAAGGCGWIIIIIYLNHSRQLLYSPWRMMMVVNTVTQLLPLSLQIMQYLLKHQLSRTCFRIFEAKLEST